VVIAASSSWRSSPSSPGAIDERVAAAAGVAHRCEQILVEVEAETERAHGDAVRRVRRSEVSQRSGIGDPDVGHSVRQHDEPIDAVAVHGFELFEPGLDAA
jgi:hypothetical protein